MMQLPVEFSEYMRHLLGENEFEALSEALQTDPSVSIRVNPWKWQDDFFSASYASVPWAEGAYYLPTRLPFTFDPLFHAGCYYVQEASSMFVHRVLKSYLPCACRMLDLCAAPGGKSTLIRAALPDGSLLVSNEIIRTRAQVLAENMIKWGHPDVVVTQNAPSDFVSLGQFFDVILADVPCSGEGMFRKDAESVGEWSMGNVDVCWQRQRSIVADAWECLKPGGVFIYSTCTYNAWEDEENVRWMIQQFGAEALSVPIEEEWGIKGDVTRREPLLPVYRFLPSCVQGEGFFLAVLRKPVEDAPEFEQAFSSVKQDFGGKKERKLQKSMRADKRKVNKSAVPSYDICRTWLAHSEDYAWTVSEDSVSAIPVQWSIVLEHLKQHLLVLHAGVTVASLKGRDWTPHHALAMSRCMHPSAFPPYELDYESAIAYLRHESVVLSMEAPRGYLLLTYRGVPLGFVKNVGNRANNLYPAEWRIRSSHVPEVPVSL